MIRALVSRTAATIFGTPDPPCRPAEPAPYVRPYATDFEPSVRAGWQGDGIGLCRDPELMRLAELTAVHGPWEAARRMEWNSQ